jgi:hypothetical protein
VSLQAGKRTLIETTASLLDFARYRPATMQRYVHAQVQDVARQLHAPPGLAGDALLEWLGRTGRVRAASMDCAALVRDADALAATGRAGPAALRALARDIFKWKREVLDGSPRDSRGDRGDTPGDRQGGRRPG